MPQHFLEGYIVILGLALLMLEAFLPPSRKSLIGWASALGLLVGFVLLLVCPISTHMSPVISRFYLIDSQSQFFKGFALITTLIVVLMSLDYRHILSGFIDNDSEASGHSGEYYILPVFACSGMMWLASAADLVSLFISLELVTISFYVMVAYMRGNVGSLEAGVKYLISGALSTGFLVYGIAWLFGSLHTTNLAEIATQLKAMESPSSGLLFGLALVLISIAFKVGAAPMQFWVADVYQGAPTPTTAFLSVGSKAAGFIMAIRILTPFLESNATHDTTATVLLIMCGATLLYGNLAALGQTNFKRLLAYSSIAHAGFILLPLAVWNSESPHLIAFYLTTYLFVTLATFFILISVYRVTGGETIRDFDGLGKTNPLIALTLTILLAAMAGLPLTAGFFAKFFIFKTAIEAHLWWIVAIAALGTAAGFYYYFKVIRAMYWHRPSQVAEAASPVELPLLSKIIVGTLTLATIFFGIYPQPLFWLMGN